MSGPRGPQCRGVKFAGTFKEFPPRSVPPSFNPANIMEETLREIKARQKLERAFPILITPPGLKPPARE